MVDHSILLQTGEPATAVILELHDGGSPDASTWIDIVLDVLPSGRPPFRATARLVRSQILSSPVQPGMQVLVKFDPANPGKVVLPSFVC